MRLLCKLNIKIRRLEVPITMLGIDIARRLQMENDIDDVFMIPLLNGIGMLIKSIKKELLSRFATREKVVPCR